MQTVASSLLRASCGPGVVAWTTAPAPAPDPSRSLEHFFFFLVQGCNLCNVDIVTVLHWFLFRLGWAPGPHGQTCVISGPLPAERLKAAIFTVPLVFLLLCRRPKPFISPNKMLVDGCLSNTCMAF